MSYRTPRGAGSLTVRRAPPRATRSDIVTHPMGSSNGPKGKSTPGSSAVCRLWPPLLVGAALLFMLSTAPDTTRPNIDGARLGAGASYRRAGEFALRERKLEAAVSMDATDQPAMRLSDVDNDSAPVELGADLATDPIDIVPANGVYAFTADDIDGTSVDLSVLQGKPTLMVNVASE